MRTVVVLFCALFFAVGAAFYFNSILLEHGDPGYVLMGFGQWSIETSLVFFVLILLACFFIFYIGLRLLGGVVLLPSRLKSRSSNQRFARSQQALIDGVLDSAEGNWGRAERILIKHATDTGTPMMHYLTAAKAAQSRGAYEKRDEYLRLAHDSTPGSEVAVGLTQVEMLLADKQFDDALTSLQALNSIAPGHGTVMKLLHKTYEALDDWESIQTLIPSLHKNKVLMEAEISLVETETYTKLLKQKVESGDANQLSQFWESIPKRIQSVPSVYSIFFAAMIEAGAGAEIERLVRDQLNKEWSDTLLVLYGCIESKDSGKQLKQAAKWLKKHPRDPILLRVMGKLSVRTKDWENAEKYLGGSIGIEPSVEAYKLLGDLLFEQDDKDRASECYRRGMILASDEVVQNVEQASLDNEDVSESPQASEEETRKTA